MAAATIRAARPADVPAIRRVARASWHAAHADIVGADAVETFVDEHYAPERLVEQVGHAGRAFYVAAVGEDAVDEDTVDEDAVDEDTVDEDAVDEDAGGVEGDTGAVEGNVVGFASAGPTEAPEAGWGLYAIYVRPDRWDEGVGSALLSRVVEWVRDRGGRRLRLVVLQDNDRAVAFYERRGFERATDHWDETLGAAGWVYVSEL